MFFDYSKRDCLLPPGCKDLIDVLKLHQPKPAPWMSIEHQRPRVIPPITRHVTLPGLVAVRQLIEVSGKKPLFIIADLMELGVFVNISGNVTFDIAANVLRWYGVGAKPVA